jgi:hypothetical protein
MVDSVVAVVHTSAAVAEATSAVVVAVTSVAADIAKPDDVNDKGPSASAGGPFVFTVMLYREEMERICTQCHAILADGVQADWCPACGGALIEREVASELASAPAQRPEVDHRGIVLPRRHALGGIITPQ